MCTLRTEEEEEATPTPRLPNTRRQTTSATFGKTKQVRPRGSPWLRGRQRRSRNVCVCSPLCCGGIVSWRVVPAHRSNPLWRRRDRPSAVAAGLQLRPHLPRAQELQRRSRTRSPAPSPAPGKSAPPPPPRRVPPWCRSRRRSNCRGLTGHRRLPRCR